MTLISIVIPAFNAEHYLEDAIQSVLAQSFINLEIIVINDGSTDQTHKILEDLARTHHQITVIDNGQNRGLAASRNVGIEAANGDWIALLDADDWWDQRRLAVLLEVAEKHSADIVADNLFFVAGHNLPPWGTLFPRKKFSVTTISINDYLHNDMPGDYGTWGLVQPIFRKSFLYKNNILYSEHLRVQEDSPFLLECFYYKPIFFICSEPFYYYRMNPTSHSSTINIADLMKLQEVNRHYLNKFRDEGAKSTCDLLSRRISRMDRYIRYRKVIEPFKRGDWTDAAKQAASDPGIVGYTVAMFLKLVSRKIRKKINQYLPRPNRDDRIR